MSADGKVVLVLYPDSDIRALAEAGWLRDLESDVDFHAGVGDLGHGSRGRLGFRRRDQWERGCFVLMPSGARQR